MTYKLIQTSGACPEQYDVFKGTEQVGYLQLRHGVFWAHIYGPHDDIVFVAYPHGDGLFEEYERDGYIRRALFAIEVGINERVNRIPEIPYEIERP